MFDFVASVSGEAFLRVEENLGDGFVRLRVSEAEKRQAKHDIRSVEDVAVELLRNARDAGAKSLYIATSRDGDIRTLVVIDDGDGIPDGMIERIFQPRVTSKLDTMVVDDWGVHGRGMALFSIRQNVDEATIVSTGRSRGTAFRVRADLTELPERADQSTFPTVSSDDVGQWSVSGPHNLVRKAVEFSLAHAQLAVYVGTPTEIAATLFHRGAGHGFTSDPERLPLVDALSAAADPAELVDLAFRVGLDISERTAQRIFSGEIEGIPAISARFTDSEISAHPDAVDLYRDRRGLKIHHDDLDAFSRALESAFETVAEKYYVSLSDLPRITVGKNAIRVRFDIEKHD